VFSEYGIDMVALLIYSANERMKGFFGIVVIMDTHTTCRTSVFQEDGIAIGELMYLCKDVLLEERQRREQHIS
jgi:hypothetical protein